MIPGHVEGLEVVVVALDLRAVGDPESEPDEDVYDLVDDLGDRVQVPERRFAARERDIDAFRLEAAGGLRRVERAAAPGDRRLQSRADRVGDHPDFLALLRLHAAEGREDSGERALE